MQENANASSGAIIFGGFDKENCGPIIAYEQLIAATFWLFQIRGVGIGSVNIRATYQAISDTGTSVIRGPKGIIDRLAIEIGAKVWHYFLKFLI